MCDALLDYPGGPSTFKAALGASGAHGIAEAIFAALYLSSLLLFLVAVIRVHHTLPTVEEARGWGEEMSMGSRAFH